MAESLRDIDFDDGDDFDDGYDAEDEIEQALSNCCGHFERDGRFWCGAAGSEDCDWECPFSRDIGLTADEIEAKDAEQEERWEAARRKAVSDACEPWFSFDARGDILHF